MKRHLRILLMFALSVTGCSSTEYLYDNADWLVQRWASGMVEASDAQQEAWREPFRLALEQHRRELLPEIISLLRTLEVQVVQGLRADQLSCWVAAVERSYRAHAGLVVPLAVTVLLEISPAQVTHLGEEMAQRNHDYRDDYLNPDLDLRQRERVARFIERIERWTGDLSTLQVAVVQKAVIAMPDVAADWLAYRRQQQQQLLALLAARPDAPKLQRFLSDWWVEFAGLTPALSDKVQQLHGDGIALAMQLDATLDAEQRAAFVANIRELRENLQGVVDPDPPMQLAQRHTKDCADSRQVVN